MCKIYLKNLVTIWTKEVVLKVTHSTLSKGTLEQWHCAWVFANHVTANYLCFLSVHESLLSSLHCCRFVCNSFLQIILCRLVNLLVSFCCYLISSCQALNLLRMNSSSYVLSSVKLLAWCYGLLKNLKQETPKVYITNSTYIYMYELTITQWFWQHLSYLLSSHRMQFQQHSV